MSMSQDAGRSESTAFPEPPSDGTIGDPFSRLGLPANEAMDDYEHLRTSTAASNAFMGGIGDEMKGFILSDTDDDSLSLPPGLAGQDGLSFQQGFTPGEHLTDILPSSMIPTEESDSQKTRRAQEPMSAMSFHTSRSKSSQSVFMLSSEGSPNEDNTKGPDATEEFLTNDPSVDYYGASPISKHRKASAGINNPGKPNESLRPAVQKSTQPNLFGLVERSKTDSTHQSRLGSKIAESVIQWEIENDRDPMPDAPPESPHKVDDLPTKVGTKRPSLDQQSPRKRPRKSGPAVIPPLPGLEGFGTKRGTRSILPSRANVSRVSELSEPRAPSRRPSSVYIDDNGSPIPEFDKSKRPPGTRPRTESLELQPSVLAPLRRSTRIKKKTSGNGSPTPTVSTIQLDVSEPKKNSQASKNQAHGVSHSLPQVHNGVGYAAQSCNSSYERAALPPLREKKYPQISCCSTPPMPVAPMPSRNFVLMNNHQVAPARAQAAIRNPFSLRPGTKRPQPLEEYVPSGVICQPEPRGLRSQLTCQIQEREIKRQRIHPREDPMMNHLPGTLQNQVATSPLVSAVHQTTSAIFKYVQNQDTIVQRVAEEYRKRTMMLIQNTRALHTREAHDTKKHLEENHSAFVDMCQSALAQIREAKMSLAAKKERMRQTKRSEAEQFGTVVDGVAKSLEKLHASLRVDESDIEDAMSMEKLQQEISRMIDEAKFGVEEEDTKKRK